MQIIPTDLVFLLSVTVMEVLSNIVSDNEIYTGCGFEPVAGQPHALKFCNAFGQCIKTTCGSGRTFSIQHCGCIQSLKIPPLTLTSDAFNVQPIPKRNTSDVYAKPPAGAVVEVVLGSAGLLEESVPPDARQPPVIRKLTTTMTYPIDSRFGGPEHGHTNYGSLSIFKGTSTMQPAELNTSSRIQTATTNIINALTTIKPRSTSMNNKTKPNTQTTKVTFPFTLTAIELLESRTIKNTTDNKTSDSNKTTSILRFTTKENNANTYKYKENNSTQATSKPSSSSITQNKTSKDFSDVTTLPTSSSIFENMLPMEPVNISERTNQSSLIYENTNQVELNLETSTLATLPVKGDSTTVSSAKPTGENLKVEWTTISEKIDLLTPRNTTIYLTNASYLSEIAESMTGNPIVSTSKLVKEDTSIKPANETTTSQYTTSSNVTVDGMSSNTQVFGTEQKYETISSVAPKSVIRTNSNLTTTLLDKTNSNHSLLNSTHSNITLTSTNKSNSYITLTSTNKSNSNITLTSTNRSNSNITLTSTNRSNSNITLTSTNKSNSNITLTSANRSNSNITLTSANRSNSNITLTSANKSNSNTSAVSLSETNSNVTIELSNNTNSNISNFETALACGSEVNITGLTRDKKLKGEGDFGYMYVGLNGVTSNNGSLRFNGRSSLWIPFYEGNRFTSGITMILTFKEDTAIQAIQGLVGNCRGGAGPSFSITLLPRLRLAKFKVTVMSKKLSYPFQETLEVTVPYMPGNVKTIEMQCNGQKLVGRVDNHVAGTYLPSTDFEITPRQSPLFVGAECPSEESDNFQGDVLNFSVYRCVRFES